VESGYVEWGFTPYEGGKVSCRRNLDTPFCEEAK